jgi:hypothetical protein
MTRDDKISVDELNRRLEQTARELKQFLTESARPERPAVLRDGDHVSVRILPDRADDE